MGVGNRRRVLGWELRKRGGSEGREEKKKNEGKESG